MSSVLGVDWEIPCMIYGYTCYVWAILDRQQMLVILTLGSLVIYPWLCSLTTHFFIPDIPDTR